MHTAKADIDWYGVPLVQHTVDLLREVCDDVVVVGAPGRALEVERARTVYDEVAGQGPLQGLAAGLAAAQPAERAFVCATDMPLLQPEFVRRVLRGLGPDVDLVLPVDEGREQPLAAAYAPRLAATVLMLLARPERRLSALSAHCRVQRVSRAELLADAALAVADPQLDSLLNVNTTDQLAAVRARAGQRRP